MGQNVDINNPPNNIPDAIQWLIQAVQQNSRRISSVSSSGSASVSIGDSVGSGIANRVLFLGADGTLTQTSSTDFIYTESQFRVAEDSTHKAILDVSTDSGLYKIGDIDGFQHSTHITVDDNTKHVIMTSSSGAVDINISGVSSSVSRVEPNKSGTYAMLSDIPAVLSILFDHYTDSGNITTGQTDLYSDTLVENQLATEGDKIEAEYGGLFVSSGTATRQIKVFFGGTAIFDTGALTLSLSSAWTIYVTIIRVAATSVRYMVSMETEGAALATYTAVGTLTGLTLSGTNILKITGTAAGVGAASGDITAKMGTVRWLSHA